MEGQADTEGDFESLLRRVKAHPDNFHYLKRLLQTMREKEIRRPDVVIAYAPNLLRKKSKLGDEVREQLLIAALESNQMALAKELLSELVRKFPSSVRVERLKGMKLEAEGKTEQALDTYNEILAKDPADNFAIKRRICIWKSQKETRPRAIQELNEYLTIFMADGKAWEELANLYLDEQQYEYAAFCWEELLISDPLNHHCHTKYAEILYTMGDFLAARKYFAHALELHKEKNTRALWGLVLSCKALASKKGGKPKDNSEVYEWASKRLSALYKGSSFSATVEPVLAQLKP